MAETKIPSKSRLAPPPDKAAAPNNLQSTPGGAGRRHTKDLNFKVSGDFHREVQAIAFFQNITMTELLTRMVELYKETHDFGDIQKMLSRRPS